MMPDRSYLVCATPRSGSTLVCQALRETGVAGRPEEYFEALRHSGPPAAARGVLRRASTTARSSTTSASAGLGDEPQQRSPLWSRAAYDRYLEWAMERRHDAERRLRREADVGLLRRLRQPAAQRSRLSATSRSPTLLPTVFPKLRFVRVVRANKVRQAVSLWKAVQTATWRQEDTAAGAGEGADAPPYKSFLAGPPAAAALPLRRDRAPARPDPGRGGPLGRVLRACEDQAGARPLRELRRRLRSGDPQRARAPRPRVSPEGHELQPRMKQAVRRDQRRLDAPLRRPQAGHPVRPRTRRRRRGGRVSATAGPQAAAAEHPLHPLPRHGPLRAAVRLRGPDAEHPAARRPGGALPRGVLRDADLLRAAGRACSPARAGSATGCSASPTAAGA